MRITGMYNGEAVEFEVPDRAVPADAKTVRIRFDVAGNELKGVSVEPAQPRALDGWVNGRVAELLRDEDLPVMFLGVPVDFSSLGDVERAAVSALMQRTRQLEERVRQLELRAAGQ